MASCSGRIEALSALLDGELEPEQELELRRHLEACGVCQAWHGQLEALSNAIASSIGRERAPRPLAQRVRRLRPALLRKRAMGAVAAAAALLAALLFWAAGPRGAETAELLIEDHREFVSGKRALAVPSSDPAEVARKLAERLPFRVAVAEVRGARLRGGHDCSLPAGRAAYLQYEHAGELVSVYLAPSLDFPVGKGEEPCQSLSGETVCTFFGSHGTVAVVASRPETAKTFRAAGRIIRSP